MKTRNLRWLVVFAAGVTLAGFVTASAHATGVDSIAGTITDRLTGAPIAGACVAVFGVDGSRKTSVCTGADGHYATGALPVDGYKLRVRAAGHVEQWAYDKPDLLNGDPVYTTDYSTAQVDFRLRSGSGGTVHGHITDEHGVSAWATVTVQSLDQMWAAIAYTDPTGLYRLKNVPPGQYKVSISDNIHAIQWAHHKETWDAATVFTVVAGASLTVNESYLPLATVTVVVTDKVTGRPVPRACAQVSSGQQPHACAGSDGIVTIHGVQPSGYADLSVYDGNGAHWNTTVFGIAVVRGKPNRFAVALDQASSIVTTVRDSTTKKPVIVCFDLVDPKGHGFAIGQRWCSDDTGRLVVGPVTPETVQLFGIPLDTAHGALWVGTTGGTGDQRKARVITTKLGQATPIPAIEVGPAGSITGIVTDKATGKPAVACAYPLAINPRGGMSRDSCSYGPDGRYTITGLGAYDWPVLFAGDVWQWSGDVSDRFDATMVKVPAGGTATLDAHMRRPGSVSGTVTDKAGTPQFGYIYAYNAHTGDFAGPNATTPFDPAGSFTLRALSPQDIKVEYWLSQSTQPCFYLNQTSLAAATPLRINTGQAAAPITLVDCH